jgi:hypothetical protein
VSGQHLPDELAAYLAARDRQRNEQVTEALAALTPTQRSLIKEAAVMGYVRGMQAPPRPILPDSLILWDVVAACLALPHLYPTIAALAHPGDQPKDTT